MVVGDRNTFGFEISLKSIETHKCELKLFIEGKNICSFKKGDDKRYTTTIWNLDELVSYLDSTLNFIVNDDKFPVDTDGECAAELDNNARDFESENEFEMEGYYNSLNEWSYAHSWHHASSGAILADVFFRKIDSGIEISWWSYQEDERITFQYPYGYSVIAFDVYEEVIQHTVKAYNDLWL